MKFVTTLRQISEEEFKEEEHPRKEDGKFASKGSGSNGKGSDLIKAEKIYDKTINATSFEETHKNLVDTVRNSSIKLENKMALNRIIKNWDLIQEKIAKDKGLCVVDDHGNYQTSSPTAVGQNELAGKDPNQMENVCSSSAKTLKKYVEKTPALKQFKIKSEIVRGNYLGKGKSHNIANRMYGDRIKAITDKNKDDNNVTKWLYDKGYKEWHGGIQHEWLKLDDGTIIDGAFGQMLPNKVENMYQRLVIITPDDPRQKWYIDHEWGVPENKDDWHLFGLESEFKEEEHPREDDGKFATKGSGSSSGQSIIHKTTKDFLRKWLADVHMKNTDIYDNLLSKGGLSIATFETKTKTRVGDRLGVGIKDKNANKDWDEAEQKFLQALEDNPKFKKVFKEYEGEVNEQNKMLQKKFESSKIFYRGGAIEELEAIFGEYSDKYSNYKWSSRYPFKSLSMNYDETLKLYNGGMLIHFNADSIRNQVSATRVNYNAKPTKYVHASVDSSIDQNKIENTKSDNPAFMMDEEEVRVDNSNMGGVKVDKIELFVDSIGFGHASNLLHKTFGIDYYGDKRNELDGLINNFYIGDRYDKTGGKYFDVIDGKIVDKKTNKVYEKTNEALKEGVKDMKLEIQNALMKNKKFREKVKEVVIR